MSFAWRVDATLESWCQSFKNMVADYICIRYVDFKYSMEKLHSDLISLQQLHDCKYSLITFFFFVRIGLVDDKQRNMIFFLYSVSVFWTHRWEVHYLLAVNVLCLQLRLFFCLLNKYIITVGKLFCNIIRKKWELGWSNLKRKLQLFLIYEEVWKYHCHTKILAILKQLSLLSMVRR